MSIMVIVMQHKQTIILISDPQNCFPFASGLRLKMFLILQQN